MAGFYDLFKCPKCKRERLIFRQGRVAGKIVKSYCGGCGKMSNAQAGFPTEKRKA